MIDINNHRDKKYYNELNEKMELNKIDTYLYHGSLKVDEQGYKNIEEMFHGAPGEKPDPEQEL